MKIIEDDSESSQQNKEEKIQSEQINEAIEEEKSPQDQQITNIKKEQIQQETENAKYQNKWEKQIRLEKNIKRGYRFDKNHFMKIKSYKEIKQNDKVTKEITFTIQNIPKQRQKVQKAISEQKQMKQSEQQIIPHVEQIVQEVANQVKTRGQLKREQQQKNLLINVQSQTKIIPKQQKKQVKQKYMSERELQEQLELLSDYENDIIKKK